MRRLRLMAVLGVVAAVLLLGTTVAQAGWGWWWNASLDVEGTEVHTEWTVVDDADGSNYGAQIKVWSPKEASVVVLDSASNETVVTPEGNQGYVCRSEGVEVRVEYLVNGVSDTAVGHQVEVRVVADGLVVAERTGEVGTRLSVEVLIPTNGVPSCASP